MDIFEHSSLSLSASSSRRNDDSGGIEGQMSRMWPWGRSLPKSDLWEGWSYYSGSIDWLQYNQTAVFFFVFWSLPVAIAASSGWCIPRAGKSPSGGRKENYIIYGLPKSSKKVLDLIAQYKRIEELFSQCTLCRKVPAVCKKWCQCGRIKILALSALCFQCSALKLNQANGEGNQLNTYVNSFICQRICNSLQPGLWSRHHSHTK